MRAEALCLIAVALLGSAACGARAEPAPAADDPRVATLTRERDALRARVEALETTLVSATPPSPAAPQTTPQPVPGGAQVVSRSAEFELDPRGGLLLKLCLQVYARDAVIGGQTLFLITEVCRAVPMREIEGSTDSELLTSLLADERFACWSRVVTPSGEVPRCWWRLGSGGSAPQGSQVPPAP